MHCFFPLGSLASSLEQELTSEVFNFRLHTIADTTKHSYRSYRDSFLRFRLLMGFTPLPSDICTVCLYAAFLACSLKFSSFNNYLGIIALLHKEFNLPNPLSDNWVLKSVLSRIKRVKSDNIKQKLPITSDIYKVSMSRLGCPPHMYASHSFCRGGLHLLFNLGSL